MNREFRNQTWGQIERMSGSTVRERQRQAREEVILEVAYDLLTEQGYDKMSMDDLAARAGLSKATLYQHFPSKEDVTVNVITRMMRLGEQDMLADDPALPAIVRLDRGLRRALSRRFQLWNSNVSIQPLKVMHNAQFKAHHERATAALQTMIEQGQVQGDIDPTLPSFVVAHMMMWLFRLDFAMLGSQQHAPIDEVINSVVNVMINGIKTTGDRSVGST